MLGVPVRNPPHAALSVAELFTEWAVLRLRVAAAVRVVERYVQKEGPSFSSVPLLLLSMLLKELPHQQFDPCDVAAHLQHRAVLLGVGEVERVHGARTHMLLPDDAWRANSLRNQSNIKQLKKL